MLFGFPRTRVSKDATLLLSRMLDKNPKKRITLEDIQKTAWYNRGYDPETPKKCVPTAVTNDQCAGTESDPEKKEVSSSALALNAFDLMNLIGGLGLANLQKSSNKRHRFESGLPVDKIVAKVKSIIQKTGMATLQSETANGMVFHIKRRRRHSTLHVDIFMALENLHIVETRCGKGDDIVYSKLMTKIQSQISKEIGISDRAPSECCKVVNR